LFGLSGEGLLAHLLLFPLLGSVAGSLDVVFVAPHSIHDPFSSNNSETHTKPYFNQFSTIPKGFISLN